MFLDFFNSKILGYCGVFFQVKTPTNSSNFKTCFRSSNPLAKNLQKNLETGRRDLQINNAICQILVVKILFQKSN